MRWPNLCWVLAERRIAHHQIAALLGVSEPTVTRKLAGRSELLPYERSRLSEYLGYRVEFLFMEMAIPSTARLQSAMSQATF